MDWAISFVNEFINLWWNGGILMWPLFILSVIIYANLFELFVRLSCYDPKKIKQSIIYNIMEKAPDQFGLRSRVNILKSDHLPFIDRRIRFISILAGVSPLLGLLGTVMGMLNTFSVMTIGSIKKIDLMAGGISEALITTQMGLIIAVPAFLMIMILREKRDNLKRFFEKIEIECLKHVIIKGAT